MRRCGEAVLAALLVVHALSGAASAMDDVVLSLPRSLRTGDALTLEITVGPLRRQRLTVSTAGGRFLGSIAPFGVAANRSSGTYTIPVPVDAVQDGRLVLRLIITDGSGERKPTTDEVTAIRLVAPPGE